MGTGRNIRVKRGKAGVSLDRQVRIAAGFMVLTSRYSEHGCIPTFTGCRIRRRRLDFAGITDWCGMGMLLAQAPWNQSKSSCCNKQSCSN